MLHGGQSSERVGGNERIFQAAARKVTDRKVGLVCKLTMSHSGLRQYASTAFASVFVWIQIGVDEQRLTLVEASYFEQNHEQRTRNVKESLTDNAK